MGLLNNPKYAYLLKDDVPQAAIFWKLQIRMPVVVCRLVCDHRLLVWILSKACLGDSFHAGLRSLWICPARFNARWIGSVGAGEEPSTTLSHIHANSWFHSPPTHIQRSCLGARARAPSSRQECDGP